MGTRISIVGVASPYAWDVVETARRAHLDPQCVDNFGGADRRLPGLVELAGVELSRQFVIGLSSSTHRAAAAVACFDAGLRHPAALVDPTAIINSTSTIDHGVFVNAGVVIASNTRIGCHSNVNRSASVGHDNRIGFAASISPGAILTGGISVGPVASIGAGATILPGITIGRRAVVGAGAVVTKDVADYEVVVGNPARLLRIAATTGGNDTCPHC